MPSISDILLEAGRQAADARRASGSILGQAVSNIGQLPGQVLAEKRQNDIAAAKSADDAQQRQIRTMQIAGAQKAAAKQTALDRIWGSGIFTEDGSFDLPKVQAATVAAGVPEAYADFKELSDKWAAGTADLKKKQDDARRAQFELSDATAEHLGSSASDIAAKGYKPDDFHLFVAKAAKDGLVDPNDANTLLEHGATPDGVKQIVDGWMQNAPSYKKSHTPEAITEQKLKDAQLLKAQQETLGTVPETPAQKSERMNREAMLTLTKMREDEAHRHNLATEQAANPYGVGSPAGAPVGTPAGEGPTGDAFLKTLDPGTAEEVKAYAEGSRPFPTGMSQSKLQPLIKLVGQYDPTFDAANYNARNKARSDFQSPNGTGGKTINALNTALQHAGKLSDLIETLDNSEYPLYNAVANPIRSAAGKTAVTNFKAVAPQLAKEIERAWRGSGGSTSDIQDLIDSIGKNMGKQQQREALSNFVDLVKGKLDATEQQRDNVMGAAGKSIPILFEQNKAMIDKIEQRAGGDAATGVPTVGSTFQGGKVLKVEKVK